MSNTAVAAPIRLVSIVRNAASRANKNSFVTPQRLPFEGKSCLEGKAEVQRSELARFLTSLNSRWVKR